MEPVLQSPPRRTGVAAAKMGRARTEKAATRANIVNVRGWVERVTGLVSGLESTRELRIVERLRWGTLTVDLTVFIPSSAQSSRGGERPAGTARQLPVFLESLHSATWPRSFGLVALGLFDLCLRMLRVA